MEDIGAVGEPPHPAQAPQLHEPIEKGAGLDGQQQNDPGEQVHGREPPGELPGRVKVAGPVPDMSVG